MGAGKRSIPGRWICQLFVRHEKKMQKGLPVTKQNKYLFLKKLYIFLFSKFFGIAFILIKTSAIYHCRFCKNFLLPLLFMAEMG